MINNTSRAVKELEQRLLKASDISYDGIDHLMRLIMKKYDVTAKQLHFGFKDKHNKTPDNWIKMKRKLNEDHKEVESGKRKDEEGYMARVELDTIDRAVNHLKKAIKKGDQQLPAWVQSKITKAADYIDTAADYLTSDEKVEESNIVNKILNSLFEEEGCSCSCDKKTCPVHSKEKEKSSRKGSKPVMSVEEISNKHGVSPSVINKQLKMGIKVEGEHTTNKEDAEAIALQHLAEKPDYYTKLKKVEAVQTESLIVTDLLGNPQFEFIDLIKPVGLAEARKHKKKKSKKKKGGTLHHWFKGSKSKDGKPGWVQADGSPCANEPGETETPKCFSSGRLRALKKKGKKGKSLIASAVRRKREEDPNQQEKAGASKPTNVSTFARGKKNKNYVKAEPGLKESINLTEARRDRPGKGSGTKDACYYKVKSRYRVWPSAYGSSALVRCRKVGAANWGNSSVNEATLPVQNGQVMQILISWRGKMLTSQLFFPQVRVPNRKEVTDAIVKIYPDAKVLSYKVGSQNVGEPLIQLPNSRSKNYLLNNKTIGEETEYLDEEGPSLSVGRGEKLSVEQGGGLTAKGRAKYNRATGSNLKAPVTGKVKRGSKAWKRRRNFCSRSRSWKRPRGLAARRRWKC